LNTVDFVRDLTKVEMDLWFEGEELRFRDPKGAINEARARHILASQAGIVAYAS
jgi:TubC N-terminal docking domain